ncbi:hypothetical protein [Actinoplanes sp. NPDC049681]|uniref:hypothetical protein n=1 Tax=Actinoplanes sp. NPDC049681 TaxID=3363905 RepID=UPI00379E8002
MRAIDLTERRLIESMEADGWEHVARADGDVVSFVRPASPEILHSVSVDLTEDDYSIQANPALGAVHPETSRLNARFLGRSDRPGAATAMVGAALQDLMPAGSSPLLPITRWGVVSADDIDGAVNALQADVADYGQPFLRPLQTLDDCIGHLQRTDRYYAQDQHLATALALQDRVPEALQVLEQFAAQAADHPPFFIQRGRLFVRSFLEHFGIDPTAVRFALGS